MNYLDDIYKLRYIKRYSNVATLHKESVAEHGFFVAAIIMQLHDAYEFDLGIALQIGVAHDMPEIELNDCPHTIKRDYPEIKKAFQVCESRVVKLLPPACAEGVREFDEQETVESKIALMADIMQCIQYAKAEIELGNRHPYMREVLENSIHRAKELGKELKQYERQT